jgi:hypothetical protein
VDSWILRGFQFGQFTLSNLNFPETNHPARSMSEREWSGNNDQAISSHDEISQLQQQQQQQLLQHIQQTTSPTISSSSLIDEYGGSPVSTNTIDRESSASSSALQEIYNLQTQARSIPVFSPTTNENENNLHGMEPNNMVEKSASWTSPRDEINYPAYGYSNGGTPVANFDPQQQQLQYPSQQQHSGPSNQQQHYSPRGPWHQTPPQPPKSPSLLFTVSYLNSLSLIPTFLCSLGSI